MHTIRQKLSSFINSLLQRIRSTQNTDGDLIYIDVAVKILLAVVLGTVLLYVCYQLVKDTILPSVYERWQQVFDLAESLQESMPGRG